jgi:hypothetical protein
MYRLSSGSTETRLIAPVALALLALAAGWLALRQSQPEPARDFEECVEQVEAEAPANDERAAMMTHCAAQFAGRRKAGGSYTYYDFMQDRNFDIAGPNPTPEERKQIDGQYIGFLDAQRREAVSAKFAKRLIEQLQADMEDAHQPAGQPIVLTPKNLLSAAAKRPADRSKSAHCVDGSLTCSWAKLSAVVKNSFASSSRTKP